MIQPWCYLISNTRFMENGKYYNNVKTEDDNYNNLNEYESLREEAQKIKVTMKKISFQMSLRLWEEYEKQQESQS